MATKPTGTYPAYVPAPPVTAPPPEAAPPAATINSQGQNLPTSSDQFQACPGASAARRVPVALPAHGFSAVHSLASATEMPGALRLRS